MSVTTKVTREQIESLIKRIFEIDFTILEAGR
jgi:hypothetical protein